MNPSRSTVLPRALAAALLCLAAWPAFGEAAATYPPDGQSRPDRGAEWWQWALSIPTPANPLPDETGADCMVGQRGSTWFLAGNFGGGTTKRQCTVPEGTRLFFPLINSVNFSAPGVCGEDPAPTPVAELRAASAAFVDGAAKVWAKLDGKRLHNLRRLRSDVFALAFPADNLFDGPCESAGGFPAGIYSPAVDDGIYASVGPLGRGRHALRFHAENPDQGFVLDVTYDLTVVPVRRR